MVGSKARAALGEIRGAVSFLYRRFQAEHPWSVGQEWCTLHLPPMRCSRPTGTRRYVERRTAQSGCGSRFCIGVLAR